MYEVSRLPIDITIGEAEKYCISVNRAISSTAAQDTRLGRLLIMMDVHDGSGSGLMFQIGTQTSPCTDWGNIVAHLKSDSVLKYLIATTPHHIPAS